MQLALYLAICMYVIPGYTYHKLGSCNSDPSIAIYILLIFSLQNFGELLKLRSTDSAIPT